MVLKVKIDGEVHEISEELKENMEYFKEADAIDKINADEAIELTTINKDAWNSILKMSEIVKNNFPQVAKVKTNDLKEVIGNDLAAFLETKSFQQINKLYQAAHFLKMQNCKKAIAASLATKVFIKQTFEDFKKRSDELKIKEELTTEKSKKMKQTYPFMN